MQSKGMDDTRSSTSRYNGVRAGGALDVADSCGRVLYGSPSAESRVYSPAAQRDSLKSARAYPDVHGVLGPQRRRLARVHAARIALRRRALRVIFERDRRAGLGGGRDAEPAELCLSAALALLRRPGPVSATASSSSSSYYYYYYYVLILILLGLTGIALR